MEIKKGEIWKVRSRGFDGIFKVLKNIETTEDNFFDAEIIEGTKTYLNRDSEGKIKQDYHKYRDKKGTHVEIDELKKKEQK